MTVQQIMFDENKRQSILASLAQTLLDAYERDDVDYYDMKDAAAYIEDHFAQVTDQSDYDYFLENLSGYWPIFKNATIIAKAGSQKEDEQQVIDKLSAYIKSFPQAT